MWLAKQKPGFYQVFQALSLDVVAGTLLLLITIESYLKIEVPWTAFACLGMATWAIYTIDHLLDVHKLQNPPRSFRRTFHLKYKKQLFALVIILLVCGITTALFLPATILKVGLLGTLFILSYFFLITRTSFWQKEICIAVGYTWGIFVAPLTLLDAHITWVQWLFVFQVFIMAFANLLLFSWYDAEKDRRDGYQSMVLKIGQKKIGAFLQGLIFFGMCSCIVAMYGAKIPSSIIMQMLVLIMFSLLLLLYRKKELFEANDWYRIIGDGIFFIPVFFLIYAQL